MGPVFSRSTLKQLKTTFDYGLSSYGFDFLWPYILKYPKDRIAIIDEIVMFHNRPIGQDYNPQRFPIHPMVEMQMILAKYAPGIILRHENYSTLLK
jgi:hypothetical protein